MIKVYVKEDRLEDGAGNVIDVHHNTFLAARRHSVTRALRREIRSALHEDVILVQTDASYDAKKDIRGAEPREG